MIRYTPPTHNAVVIRLHTTKQKKKQDARTHPAQPREHALDVRLVRAA